MESVFKEHLLEAYQEDFPEQQDAINYSLFLDYLITCQLIDTLTIRRYTIIKEFEKEYPKHNGHKTQTVYTIANKFNLTDRTVWTVLKDHIDRFKKGV